MKPLLNREEIDNLLQRYLEGETTLQEERQLRDWFSSNEVPPELSQYHAMLGYFADGLQTTCPAEKQQPNMELHIAHHKKGRPRRIIYIWTSVAAAIMFVAFGLNYMRIQKIEDEKKALLAEQNEMSLKAFGDMAEALMLVSETLNKGMAPVSEAAKATDVTSEGSALAAIGDAFSALNKATILLMPSPDGEDEQQTIENSGI
ncbi:MAG TPA: hypothetical protein DEO70_04595 [Bacteroidales bacterium]|nr:MAG: hypothetical protein A2X11_00410 [Bacteroidetes bacterium GWE2_42_24]OFY27570.1 MAG: hypothetical protein A2X09_07815 [Bacteroidetes bacterium GWF2_43_11]PKP22586.1 MAG: hypothetical protein CVU06_09330 [Bacteroidetes bacterium HGW-Bacteroidetes-22]HBZ66094.1 hypothetical protein [Bacteroidales bacterium]